MFARERISVNPSHPPTRMNELRPPPSATSLVSGGTCTPCCYYNQLHLPSSCNVVPQAEARKQALRRSGRRFSCLRKGHLSRDCRSQGRCRICRGHHRSSICSNHLNTLKLVTAQNNTECDQPHCYSSESQCSRLYSYTTNHSEWSNCPTANYFVTIC